MNKTKNDLSANTVVLDYEALQKTASIAYAHSRNRLQELLGKTYYKQSSTDMAMVGQRVLEVAEQFVVAAETLAALEGGLERGCVVVTNKPPEKEEGGDE